MESAAVERFEYYEVNKERLVSENIQLVKIIAYQVAVNLPQHIDIDDLISAGTVGLLEAIDRFDWSRDVQFNTYASKRIRGAMLDELRGLDWMTRSMRDKCKRLEKAYHEIESKKGMPAKIEEVAEHLEISVNALHKIIGEVRLSGDVKLEDIGRGRDWEGMTILDCIKDPDAADPSANMNLNEFKRILTMALDELPEREKMVLSLYYFDELTLVEIATVFELTESRVCQIHKLALKHLGVKLKKSDCPSPF
jgi:RNA polymerase sigma factor for flagellar operon FliA